MNTLRDLSGTSDGDDSDLYGPCNGDNEEVPGDSGDEQGAQRIMVTPAPEANAQELRKVSIIPIHPFAMYHCNCLSGSWSRSTRLLRYSHQAP
jgi:hypothetical protein